MRVRAEVKKPSFRPVDNARRKRIGMDESAANQDSTSRFIQFTRADDGDLIAAHVERNKTRRPTTVSATPRDLRLYRKISKCKNLSLLPDVSMTNFFKKLIRYQRNSDIAKNRTVMAILFYRGKKSLKLRFYCILPYKRFV